MSEVDLVRAVELLSVGTVIYDILNEGHGRIIRLVYVCLLS